MGLAVDLGINPLDVGIRMFQIGSKVKVVEHDSSSE